MQKYVNFAKDHGMIDAMIISPENIFFDIRAILKCSWGCDRSTSENIRCDNRNTSIGERIDMVKQYASILLVHSHSATELYRVLLQLEKVAFLDGYYFAFTLRACAFCDECKVKIGEACSFPDRIRPCDQLFGIDVYKTVRKLGLPCEVLQSKEDVQNRYGFLLID